MLSVTLDTNARPDCLTEGDLSHTSFREKNISTFITLLVTTVKRTFYSMKQRARGKAQAFITPLKIAFECHL